MRVVGASHAKLGGFQQRAPRGRPKWDRQTTSDVTWQSDIDKLNDMINAASGDCDGFKIVQKRLEQVVNVHPPHQLL